MPSVRITPNRLNADEHNTKQNLQPKRGTHTHTHTHLSFHVINRIKKALCLSLVGKLRPSGLDHQLFL